MTAYADPLNRVPGAPRPGWKWNTSCHLVADSLEELHAFAESIGMKRAWFQDGRRPHYDLTAKRRKVAVRRGAREVTSRELLVVSLRLGAAEASP